MQKDEKRKEALAGKCARAGHHNEVVAAKLAKSQEQLIEEPQKRAIAIDTAMEVHTQKAGAQIASRQERAGQHNEKVLERMAEIHRVQQEKQQEIQAKWEQKKGSKVSGEPFSRVEQGSTGSPTGASSQADAGASATEAATPSVPAPVPKKAGCLTM